MCRDSCGETLSLSRPYLGFHIRESVISEDFGVHFAGFHSNDALLGTQVFWFVPRW